MGASQAKDCKQLIFPCASKPGVLHTEVHTDNDHDDTHAHEDDLQRMVMLRSKTSEIGDWKGRVQNNPDRTKLFEEHQKLLAGAGAKYEDLRTSLTKDDVLVVVDMQNDFMPQSDAPEGGRFGVAEGGTAAVEILSLIDKAARGGALIVATRDYHPKNHCSFMPDGPFPPHCIQGSKGSFLFEPIEKALKKAKEDGADVRIVFKGFERQCDSFGALTYGAKYFTERHLGSEKDKTQPKTKVHSCAALDWTGSFGLECSNLDESLNAPPDVMAVFDRTPLRDILKERSSKRIFAVGLAMDFCVLDTALNAASAQLVTGGIYMPVDATRAAHISGIGEFGTGFLSDPKGFVKKCETAGVKLCRVAGIS